MLDYSLIGLILWVTGSAAAAAVGRSFRAGLWACAWGDCAGCAADHRRLAGRGAGLVSAGRRDAPGREGGIGVGGNLGDAVWWTLPSLLLWALPLGVLGAAVGSARARRRRAREHGDLASTT
jgi:hypothetical protein